ncbi:MAG: recombinase family protein [Lachnospiraceae bacterium]|nr:recombinase family protein [Lachnospiraceae bacterium]
MADNIACYIRLSLADGEVGTFKDESNSIKNQRDLLHKYIDTHAEFDGWNVLEFVDDGYTGTNDDRPEFQRLLELTRQGQIQCIIVKDLSRFARNYIITGDYLEQIFPVLGVRFIAVTDHYDSANSTTVEDNMSMVLKSVLNAYYSKDLSRKIQASVHQRMRQGTYLPPPPFGYLVNEDRTNYVIDPPAAATIQRIFALALEGKTRMEIANALNAEGLVTPAVYNRNNSRTKKGSLPLVSDHPCWEPNQLSRFLREQTYVGDRVMRRVVPTAPGSKRMRPAKPEEMIIHKDVHPAIISREDFEKVQLLFPRQVHKQRSNKPQSVYLLKGVARCGTCKRALGHTADGTKFFCRYSKLEASPCSPHQYPMEAVEKVVFDSIQPMIRLALEVTKPKKKGADNTGQLLARCRKEIQDVQYQLKRTRQLKLDAYEAYASERLSLKDYQDKKNLLTEQAKELERRLAVLGEQESAMNNGIIPHDVQAVADAAHTYQHVHSLTREMVEAFVESVYLYDETHYEIVWKYKDAWAQLTGQTEKGAQNNE